MVKKSGPKNARRAAGLNDSKAWQLLAARKDYALQGFALQ
jgi:hypothetical protein